MKISSMDVRQECRMYANYKYSLNPQQLDAIHFFLRMVPPEMQDSDAWVLLYELSEADSWSASPKFAVPE